MAWNIEEYLANPIKQHILSEILKRQTAKYSELMPPDTDNVLFNYHLQHLVKVGLLEKKENMYSFTPDGQKATAPMTYNGLYFQKFVARFHMYLIDGDNVLMQYHPFSPFKGDTTAVSSKLMYGTPVTERANMRITEKTGLRADMKLAGTVRTIITRPDKEVLDDSIYFIMYATKHTGLLNEKDDNDNPLAWYSFDEAIKLEQKNAGSGDKTVEVLKRFQTKNFETFAFEEYLTANSL